MSSTAKKRHTVVYTHGGGRFGNQLLRFFHLLAWTIEQEGRVCTVDMAFWPFARYFATWSRNPGCVYPGFRRWAEVAGRIREILPERLLYHSEWRLQRAVFGAARFLRRTGSLNTIDVPPGGRILMGSVPFLESVYQNRWNFVSGWELSCWDLLEKHQVEVRSLFEPAPKWAAGTAAAMRDLRQKHDFIIGVQIRRSDYREWCAGEYFFPIENYVRWIRELIAIHAPRNVGVVVVGDEVPPADAFIGLPVTVVGSHSGRIGHWISNFLRLIDCDLIVSPPSTFSACAAFLGNRPILPLRSARQVILPDQVLERGIFAAAEDADFSRAVM